MGVHEMWNQLKHLKKKNRYFYDDDVPKQLCETESWRWCLIVMNLQAIIT